MRQTIGNDERRAFAKRLNLALELAGAPRKGGGRQVVTAQWFDVSQAAARKWLEGESMPSTKRLPDIARRLSVSVEWLLRGDPTVSGLAASRRGGDDESSPIPAGVRIPHVAWNEAGQAIDTSACRWHAYIGPGSGRAFALTVEGEAMLPEYMPGDVVVLEPEVLPEQGDDVIARCVSDAGGEVVLRRFSSEGGQRYLRLLNLDYPDRVRRLMPDDEVVGVVVKQIRRRRTLTKEGAADGRR